MYGNFEYGSIPYGDSYLVTRVVIITPGNIDVIFTVCRRTLSFLSQDKTDLFFSVDPHTTTFVAKKRETSFLSSGKKSSFISNDKPGKRCGR